MHVVNLAMRSVYPRVCGGTCKRLLRRVFCDGLSPRMRGNPRSARRLECVGRSIPAYAGEPQSHQP